jgi:two-component system NtrC family sensor kinase
MSPLRRLLRAIESTVRYKLLVLVLFPIVLVMPVTLALAAYWGQKFSYRQLYMKVNTDLSVAHDAYVSVRRHYLEEIAALAESYQFRIDLERRNARQIHEQLILLRERARFSFLHLVDRQRNWLYEPSGRTGPSRRSLLVDQAFTGVAASGIEIHSNEELGQEDPDLAERVRLRLIDTPRAVPTERKVEDRGMVIRVAYPVKNAAGEVVAVLDGGVLLNGNFRFVDAIRDLVYGPGSLPQDSIGAVTVFLDDVRISTNVPLRPGERALGTRVSKEVRDQVLGRGEVWIDRAFVVNDWYISSYEPILDVRGKRVGMLYAGFLEAPFARWLLNAFAGLVLMFLVLIVISSVVAWQGARSIFKPLESMSRVVRATREGEDRRIGNVASSDEIGELAREFDKMLDLLKERNQQIQLAADQLEQKVEERTAQLKQRNEELQRTISVLRDTRQQLVIAEKLAALGELTAGIAHEINNPAAVILGNIDLLVDELGPGAEPVRAEIELIIQQIYRIKEIIDNLLQYARPSQFAGYVSTVDVNETVRDTLKLVQHLTRSQPVEITLDLKASLTVQINRAELQQVLVNLLVNAIHALEAKGGEVTVRTRDWEQRGVTITVKDTGVGIAPENLDNVFNPFFSTKGQGKGTGLGLSISYGLIRRYGGTITVASEPGVGAEFTVHLLSEAEFVEDEETLVEQLRAY